MFRRPARGLREAELQNCLVLWGRHEPAAGRFAAGVAHPR